MAEQAAVTERPAWAMGVAIPDTRLHPIYLVIETAKTLRSAIPFLVVTLLGGAPFWVNAALFASVMVIAVAQWHVKKYSVISGVLRLRAGLFNRTVRVVPVSRITALDAYRSLSQRLVGVWGLKVQSPGDRNGSAVVLGSLSGRRLDEVRAALRVRPGEPASPDPGSKNLAFTDPASADRTQPPAPEPGPATRAATGSGAEAPDSGGAPSHPSSDPGGGTGHHGPRDSSTLQRYLSWRRSTSTATPKRGPDVIAVLRTREMLFATITNNTIPLIFAVALVTWYRFSEFVPSRAADFMHQSVEPRGAIAVVVALVVVAIVLGVVTNALRLNQFTLIRDGDVLRNSRGLLGTQSGTVPVARVQAVRIVEGIWRAPFGYCSLQVEVAGLGVANTNRRMLFPLIKTDRARALLGRALPEIAWPAEPLTALPQRLHRRYFTVPMEYGAGFTLLLVLLPGWWRLLAVLPLPLACLLAVCRAREARWHVDDRAVVLRWRRVLSRNTVIAHRTGAQRTEWSSSPWKARAGVAGFTMHFSSGRRAKMRYMLAPDALLLLRAVGRPSVPDRHPGARLRSASTVDGDVLPSR